MTIGDGLFLAMMSTIAVALLAQWRRDRAEGRAQVRPGVPRARLLAGAAAFGALAVASAVGGVVWLGTPGTHVVESGRLAGAEVHHRVFGVFALGVAATLGWLVRVLLVAARRPVAATGIATVDPPEQAEVPPPAPTVEAARDAWRRARDATPPGPDALAAAARLLAGALAERMPAGGTTTELLADLPAEVAVAVGPLLVELDRVRFAGAPLDLPSLDAAVESACARSRAPDGRRHRVNRV